MAVTIQPIAEQNIVTGAEFMLNIPLATDDTITTARVEGLLEGFYYNWNAADSRIEIRGTATRLILGEEFTVYATDGDGEVSAMGMFHVIPAAPVITSVPAQTLYRGI